MDAAQQLKFIRRGASEILTEDELLGLLKTRRPLRVKVGFDPTAPDLHLGHTVLLRKLKHFQDLGHEVLFLIGDATALVGDPSGQSQTRKILTWDEVGQNARTFEQQIGKILDTDNPKRFTRRHNSEWFSRYGGPRQSVLAPFDFDDFVELAQKYTVARLLERDDFQKRLKEGRPISFLELFYPLMQGYDSVKLKADVEVGGTDQKFNMLVGRDIQQAYGMAPQVVITMPLLEGTDGIQKMSKSLGNTVGINEPAREIFGKLMSISDVLMYRYYELLTNEDLDAVKRLHPKEAKLQLAHRIVSDYYGSEHASKERKHFEKVFSRGDIPKDLPLRKVPVEADQLPLISLPDLGVELLYTQNSKNELRRLIRQGAVKVNGRKVTLVNFSLCVGQEYLVQIAKRSFVRLLLVRKP